MAGNIAGMHFEASANGIVIFGWDLKKISSMKWMLFNHEIEPLSVVSDILALIQSDIEAGNEHKIDHILVSEEVFAVLFCEGRVTVADMRRATETEDAVILPGVDFLGKEYTVRVMDENVLNRRFGNKNFRMATIDAQGAIV